MKNIKLFQMPKCLSVCLSVRPPDSVCLSDSCTDKRLARTRNMLGEKSLKRGRGMLQGAKAKAKAVEWGVLWQCGALLHNFAIALQQIAVDCFT